MAVEVLSEMEQTVLDALRRLDVVKQVAVQFQPRSSVNKIEPKLAPTIQIQTPHAASAHVPELPTEGSVVCKLVRALSYLRTLADQLYLDTSESLLPSLFLIQGSEASSISLDACTTSGPRQSGQRTDEAEAQLHNGCRELGKHAAVLMEMLKRQENLEAVLKNLLAQTEALASDGSTGDSPMPHACVHACLDAMTVCLVTLLQIQIVVAQNWSIRGMLRCASILLSKSSTSSIPFDVRTLGITLRPGSTDANNPREEALQVVTQLKYLVHPASSLQRFLEWEVCGGNLGARLRSRPFLKDLSALICSRMPVALSNACCANPGPDAGHQLQREICLCLLYICLARNQANKRVLKFLTHDIPSALPRLFIWGSVHLKTFSIVRFFLPHQLRFIVPQHLFKNPDVHLSSHSQSGFGAAQMAPSSAPSSANVSDSQIASIRRHVEHLHLSSSAWLLRMQKSIWDKLPFDNDESAPAVGVSRPGSTQNFQRPPSVYAHSQPQSRNYTQSDDGTNSIHPSVRDAGSPDVGVRCTQADSVANDLLDLARDIIAGRTLLQQSVNACHQVSDLFVRSLSTSSPLAALMLRLVATAQALRAWFEDHASQLAQFLPLVMAHGMQVLCSKVKKQISALHNSRPRKFGRLTLWQALLGQHTTLNQADRASLLATMHASMQTSPSRYQFNETLLATRVLQSSGAAASSVCTDMILCIDVVQNFLSICSGAHTRCDDQLFLMQRPQVIDTLLKHMQIHPASALLIPLLARSLDSDARLLRHDAQPESARQAHCLEVLSLVEDSFLMPVAVKIQDQLQQQVNSQLMGSPCVTDSGPLKSKHVAAVILMPCFTLMGRAVCIRDYVSSYLYSECFRQTAHVQQSWSVFRQLTSLASLKYGLSANGFLPPAQQVKVTHDVQALLSDVAFFCESNCYNLAAHMFVESPSCNVDSEALNSLSIVHCTASFQTHGLGLLQAVTRAVYNFLVETLNDLAEWLFDREVQARLQTDLTAFTQLRATQRNGEYTVERAQAVIMDAQRQAEHEGQQRHYVDAIRQLLTLIGNAVALLRLAHHGALHLATSTLPFLVPHSDKDDAWNPRKAASTESKAPAVDSSDHSTARMDRLASEMRSIIERWPHHLQALVATFSADLRSQSNVHFQRFYLLIPALCHNYVEVMLLSKERLSRRNGEPEAMLAAFTDDGFPLGIAYMLTVLQQGAQFDALHWFSAAHSHYTDQAEAIRKSAVQPYTLAGLVGYGQRSDVEVETEGQNKKLRLQRANAYAEEYHLLGRTLESCRTLFTNA